MRPDPDAQKCLSLDAIAARWGVSHGTVLNHVYSGALRAIDVSTNPRRKSRYVVPPEALAEFEASRMTPPPSPPPPPRRRPRAAQSEVIEYFA
jgi:hypothetical protein